MSYQVLARKWRPKNFNEIVGQDSTLRMLSNALDNERLHHAYLFTGTRGIGKTTLARIFAKCLNCEKKISSTPCNNCDTCKAIDEGRFIDLLEIDAASRTKVEDTREILDNVPYAPTAGRFKIYLIDESHMLSTHSFNALLKTLEEPPAHVKFLLATTDPKKLPITILSRCLQFHLKRVSIENISEHLKNICEAEKINFERPALELLAHAADGSLRDALSLLDQSIAYCNNTLVTKEIRNMLGTVEHETLFELLKALAEKNGKKLLSEISKLTEVISQFDRLLEALLSVLHKIAVHQTVSDAPADDMIKQLAKNFSAEDIQLYYQIALIGRRDLPYTPHPALGFEMIMLRMLAFHPATHTTTTEKKIMEPQKITDTQNWSHILSELKLTGMAHALASNCVLQKISDTHFEFALSEKHQPMMNTNLIERIEQALTQHQHRAIKIKIIITKDELNTPAKHQQQQQQERLATATSTIKNDSNVQKMIDIFDATLSTDSIVSTDN